MFRFLLLFSMITSADTEDIVVATELESQLVPAVSYSVENDPEAKKTFLEGLCAHLTTKDKNGTILHKVTLDMDETQYIKKRAITRKQMDYLISSNLI